jgi:hypothetical protein
MPLNTLVLFLPHGIKNKWDVQNSNIFSIFMFLCGKINKVYIFSNPRVGVHVVLYS